MIKKVTKPKTPAQIAREQANKEKVKNQQREMEKEKMIQKILQIINEYSITTIKGVAAYLPFTRATFYNNGFDKLDIIKDAIDNKKVELKESLRSKWFLSDNPTLQIALYKLLADETELKALNNSITVENKKTLGVEEMSDDQLDMLYEQFTARAQD
jgi:hypothetical protein